MINEGVRRAYLDPDNTLRASILARSRRQADEYEGQHAGRRALRPRARRHGRRAHRGEGRRLGEQGEVHDAEPVRLDRRLGAEDRADDGRRLVSAGHARHRHRRQRRKGDGPREGSADGPDRHARAEGAGSGEPARGAARRALRQGQRARHRRAGARRPCDGARREDPRLSDARGKLAGGDHPQLRGDAARAFHARRQRRCEARSARSRARGPTCTGHRHPNRAASTSMR